MKKVLSFFLCALACGGCATQKRYVSFVGFQPVKVKGPGEYMFVDGEQAWYSALQFVEIAEAYAKQEHLSFDFTNTKKTIWVFTDGLPALASVQFSHGAGQSYLYVDIDRSGKAVRYHTGIWTCGEKQSK